MDEIKFLTDAETTRLYRVISQESSIHSLRNKAMFTIAKYCALRASEVGLIKITDFDVLRNTIYCRRLKGSNNNTLKIIDKDLQKILKEYRNYRLTLDYGQDYLFPSQKGYPISRKTLDVIMKNYCTKANIPFDKRHFHVLKHTRAIELIEDYELSIRDVQWWLGHKNINNTMIYLEYSEKAMSTLFKNMELKEVKIKKNK